MSTEGTPKFFEFHFLPGRQIRGRLEGGTITSEAGGWLLREVEKRTGILERFAARFVDHRDRERMEHTVKELIAQRVEGLALGYEDLNDHDQLRQDPWRAGWAEKEDPRGESRAGERDQGKARAGKSTLNRRELTKAVGEEKEPYPEIVIDQQAVDRLRVEVFRETPEKAPSEITVDLEATEDPLPGNPEGRFFNGYSGHDGYRPPARPSSRRPWSRGQVN